MNATIPTLRTLCFNALATTAGDTPRVDVLPPQLLNEFTRRSADVRRMRELDAEMVELQTAVENVKHLRRGKTERTVYLLVLAHGVLTELDEVRKRLEQ
jgi:hypothetical protein